MTFIKVSSSLIFLDPSKVFPFCINKTWILSWFLHFSLYPAVPFEFAGHLSVMPEHLCASVLADEAHTQNSRGVDANCIPAVLTVTSVSLRSVWVGVQRLPPASVSLFFLLSPVGSCPSWRSCWGTLSLVHPDGSLELSEFSRKPHETNKPFSS